MQELAANLRRALEELIVRARKDPGEIRERLARRSKPSLTRPPRAWCLAVRASDTRITPTNGGIDPQYAVEPCYRRKRLKTKVGETRPLPVREEIRPHRVRVTSELLARICPPVRVSYGLTPREIAPLLGISESFVHNLRKGGVLKFERRPLLHGRRGIGPLMLVESATVDPSSLDLKRLPDPLWLTLWQYQMYQMPRDIDQTIARHPVYRNLPNRGRTESRLCFRGFTWLCPICHRPARVLYYPLPAIALPGLHRPMKRLAKMAAGGARTPPLPVTHKGSEKALVAKSSFGCYQCHRVRYFTRLGPGSWGEMVSYLTSGLVYGREVPRPAGFEATRKRAYRPSSNLRPSKRRDDVQRLLVDTHLTYRQIAAELGLKYAAVNNDVLMIYKQNKVRTRQALVLLLRPERPIPELPPLRPSPKRVEFVRRFVAGQALDRIAQEMGLSACAAICHLRRYRRRLREISSRPIPSAT